MNPNLILCPKCNTEISIPEVLRKQSEEQIRKDVQEEEGKKFSAKMEEALRKQKEDDIQKNKLTQDRLKEVEDQNEKIRQENLATLKEKNKLEDQIKERDLEEEKRLREETKKAHEEGMSQANEKHRLREVEFEQQNLSLKKRLDEALQKIEQGSQQSQGEALEIVLENLLKSEFPNDEIKPVPPGMRGADVIHIIHGSSGEVIGKIIWESKRAKDFGKDWIDTLKTNSVKVGADVAILVTTIMPKEIKNFGPKAGVYITNFECVREIAKLIRGTLLKVYKVKQENLGRDQKKDILWSFLTSNQFSQKFAMIVEGFIAEKEGIDREKRAYSRIWSEREKRLERIIDTAAMLYGDLQGLTGASLPQIASLEITTTETLEDFDSKQVLDENVASFAYTKETTVVVNDIPRVDIDESSRQA